MSQIPTYPHPAGLEYSERSNEFCAVIPAAFLRPGLSVFVEYGNGNGDHVRVTAVWPTRDVVSIRLDDGDVHFLKPGALVKTWVEAGE